MRTARPPDGVVRCDARIFHWAGADARRLSAHAADFGMPQTPAGRHGRAAQHMASMTGGAGATVAGSFADANGMALYTFRGDTVAGQSTCAGGLRGHPGRHWPRCDAAAIGDWSVIARADGSSNGPSAESRSTASQRTPKSGEAMARAPITPVATGTLPVSPDEVPSPRGHGAVDRQCAR